MTDPTYLQFESDARAKGFDEVLERHWAPDLATGTHVHPFDVSARVATGEFRLTVGADTRHLLAGDCFELDREVPHAERYGPQGAVVWVARRNGPAKAVG